MTASFRRRAPGAWLVTGGASGFGKTYASRLAAMGHDVVLWDRDAPGLARAREEIGARVVHEAVVDVAEAGSVEAAAAATRARARVRHVIHCAGVLRVGGAVEMPASDYALMIGVNLLGSIHVARAWVPELARAEGGRATLLLVSSVAGLRGFPELAGYSASKHGVVGFARALRDELAGAPVDVKVLCPPPGDTPMVRSLPRLPPIYRLSRMFTADEVVSASIAGLEGRGFLQLVDPKSRLTRIVDAIAPRVVDLYIQRATRAGRG